VTRLLYLVSHPIQYQAPLLRRIAREPDLRLRVVFGALASAARHHEPDFGRDVAWDVPLLDGYDHAALVSLDLEQEITTTDVLWVHGWQHAWQRRAVDLAARRGIPVLIRGENWFGAMPEPPRPFGWLKRAWRKRIFARCGAFLAIGSGNRNYYQAHGIPADRIVSMPYAVDNAFFAAHADASADRRDALRRELGLAPDQRTLLFVGKLMARKRPDLLLAAWRTAPWPGTKPALLFAGDGEMRVALETEADGARVLGFRNQSELPALYALSDLLVVPSEREPWGLVVNEAMACGTGVVASDQVGAAHDLLAPDCGAVFRANDREDLVAKLMQALPAAAELGRNARRRIADWDFEADVRGLRQALGRVGR
jgi:glycosyltransferase involved in cell wall biosynthesis